MSPYRILIVEDEKIIAKDLELRLKRMHYQVIGSVTNCEDCLATLTTQTPDLILMDIMIDGPRDGIETAHLVRERYDIPIIFLTAYADESTFQRAKLSDPFGYILKPFQERELDLSVQTVLQKHGLERKIKESEQRYRILFETTQEAMLVLDDEGVPVEANAAAYALYGWPQGILPTQPIYKLLGATGLDRLEAWLSALALGNTSGGFAFGRPDGEIRHVEYSLQAGYLPHRHLVVMRDVTQKVNDSRQIETLARIPAEAPAPILRVDVDGKLLYANKTAQKDFAAWLADGITMPARLIDTLTKLSAKEPERSSSHQIAGRHFDILAVLVPEAGYINLYATDVTDKHHSEQLMMLQKDVLEGVALGKPLRQVLARLADGVRNALTDQEVMFFFCPNKAQGWDWLSSFTLPEAQEKGIMRYLATGPTVAVADLHGRMASPEAAQMASEFAFGGVPARAMIYEADRATRDESRMVMVSLAAQSASDGPYELEYLRLAVRLAQLALERSVTQEQLHNQALAFENIHDAIILTDLKGVVTEWSPAAERIFNLAKQDVLGRKLAGVDRLPFSQNGQDSHGAPSRGARPGTIPQEVREATFTLPDYKQGWAEITKLDLLDREGRRVGNVHLARDITAKRAVEQQLDVSEQHLKAIFDNSVQSFVLLDLQGKVLAFNKLAETQVHKYWSKKLRKNGSIAQTWLSGNQARFKATLKAALAGQLQSYEDFFITDEDESVWLEINLLPVFAQGGEQTGVCLTALDIRERKQSQQTLARSEARFRSLVQHSSDLILLLDKEGVIVYASESCVGITGYSAERLVGNKITDFTYARDKLRVVDALRRATDHEHPAGVALEYLFYKDDGSSIILESVITNRLADTALRSLVVNSRDISERKAAEDALRNIVRGVSVFAEEDYFVSLARNLSVYLGLPDVVIAEVNESGHLHDLGLVLGNEPSTRAQGGVGGVFCQDVLHAGYLYVSNLAGTHYQHDPLLTGFKAASTLGVALRDSHNRPLGIVVAASPGVIENFALAESMLKIFSVRAAMELERINATRALLESKANLTALVENTTDAIWAIDGSYRFTALNSSFRQRFAHLFTDGADVADNALDLMVESERQEWKACYDKALTGERFTLETSLNDGRTQAQYEVSFNPIASAHGQVQGVSIFARDITERKKAELALRQSEANLLALIENTDDIIYSLDDELNILISNSAFAKAVQGEGPKPVRPKNIIALPQNEFGQAWADYYARAFNGERFSEEIPLPDGEAQRELEASFNPIKAKGQTGVNGIAVIARDITERKKAERELKQTNFELDSFVYRASHDLRAPLRSVLGLINLIKIETADAKKVEYLGLAEKSINKLDTFISDLTHFSRNTRMELVSAKVDFEGIIAECMENLRYMEKADRVTADIQIDQQAAFYSDPARITIIFQNLISNAIKYQRTDVESYLRINIAAGPERCTIVVEDNGKGIHEEYLSRIFEMFFRASEDSYGSGLGLYITAQVVEKLGGKLGVTSTLGIGTRFELWLPNKAALAAQNG